MNNLPHGIINFAGQTIRAIAAGHQVPPQEYLLVAGLKGHLAQITHAEASHHLAGDRGNLLDVTAGTGCDFSMAEDNLFRCPTTQGSHNSGPELGSADEHLLFIRCKPGEALGLAAGNQGDLLNRIVGLHQGAHQGMAHLVISDQTLTASVGEGFALHAGDDPVDGIVDFGQPGGLLATTGGENCGLIEQVGQIRSGKSRGSAGNCLEAHICRQNLVAAVHLQH